MARRLALVLPRLWAAVALIAGLLLPVHASGQPAPCCWITEIDADQDGTDTLEFVELGGPPGARLDTYRLVLFSGGADTFPSYFTLRLDGYAIPAHGRLVIGSPGVANVALIAWQDNGLQNAGSRPDAVALYRNDAEPAAPTPTSLVDVLVYGDSDWFPFRAAFNPAAPPPLAPLDGPSTSIGRDSAGSIVSGFIPTPGDENGLLRINEVDLTVSAGAPFVELLGAPGLALGGYVLAGYAEPGVRVWALPLTGVLPAGGAFPGGAVFSVPDLPGLGLRAVALYRAAAPDQPSGTGLLDAVVTGRPDAEWRGWFGGLRTLSPPEDSATSLARWAGDAGAGAKVSLTVPSPNAANGGQPLAERSLGEVNGPIFPADDARSHVPDSLGRRVTVSGTVTAVLRDSSRLNAVIQAEPDGDLWTSDSLQVALDISGTLGGPPLSPGDRVTVTGTAEWLASGAMLTGLSGVQIAPGGPLPQPVEIDPSAILSSAERDRFWARLDGMRVRLASGALVVGPSLRQTNGESSVVVIPAQHPVALRPDANARRLYRPGHPLADDSRYGSVVLSASALQAATPNAVLPAATVGDRLAGPVTGVVRRNNGLFEIAVDSLPVITPGPVPASPAPPTDREAGFTVATYNVRNLYDRLDDPYDANDDPGAPYVPFSMQRYEEKLNKTADLILRSLGAPDIMTLQELEDQDLCRGGGQLTGQCGTADNADGLPDVLQDLAAAVFSRSDGDIAYRMVSRRAGADGRGISVGFLYRADRVELAPVGPADALFGTRAGDPDGVAFAENRLIANPKALNASAGPDVAVDGDGPALFGRGPLAARFTIRANTLLTVTVIGVHLKSDASAFRPRRRAQSAYLAGLAAEALHDDPAALVLVAGDFNDVDGSPQLAPLFDDPLPGGTRLTVVDRRAEAANRYSFVFQGEAQDIDHLVASPELALRVRWAGYVHSNSDFADSLQFNAGTPRRASDHDPLAAYVGFTPLPYRLAIPAAPVR